MRRPSACSSPAWDFSRVEEFWDRFAPLSPYGRDLREERLVLADPVAIERLHEATDVALAFMRSQCGVDPNGDADKTGSIALDRLSYHLKRLPRIPLDARGGASYELIELFQVKKFIGNYRAIRGLLDEGTRDFFRLGPEPATLAAELDRGGSDAETFYIADAYDPRLHGTRSRIEELDARIAAIRVRARDRAIREHGLDFRGRDFLVVAHEAARGIVKDRGLFSVEPYDASHWIVRLEPDEEELALDSEREAARTEERVLEEGAIAGLSRLVAEALPRLGELVGAVTEFDLARARAVLAEKFDLVRPVIAEVRDGHLPPLEVSGGRFLPCEWECGRLGLRYTPLDFRLEENAAVLFGSNMGGKTVALESLVFFQVLAQAGFFVPATRYSTSIYPHIHYVGELKGRRVGEAERKAASRGILAGGASASAAAGGPGSAGLPSEGLSGFGFEIRAFVDAWENASDGALVVFDEFARTTSSREAEAVLSAALEALASRRGLRSLFSTHFRGVARLPGVRYLRVPGLDRRAASEALAADEPIGERIKRINGMMTYGVEDDEGSGPSGSDAVVIAALLGLDREIAARAEAFYAKAISREGQDRTKCREP